jgi:transposase
LAVLQLAEDARAPQIAKVIPLTPQAIRRLGHRYEQAGLDGALYEKQRPGAAEVLDTSQKQRIIAIVRRRGAPVGRCAWRPKKPSNGNWFPVWEEKLSAFYCSTTT